LTRSKQIPRETPHGQMPGGSLNRWSTRDPLRPVGQIIASTNEGNLRQ
jgi:hypothetical protein